MKVVLASLMLLGSSQALAQNLCTRYENRPLYLAAIQAVAQTEKMTFEGLCSNAEILDIEAQPSHTVTREGEVIPHVQLQLHMNYRSCLYMVRNADKVITSSRCYSGW